MNYHQLKMILDAGQLKVGPRRPPVWGKLEMYEQGPNARYILGRTVFMITPHPMNKLPRYEELLEGDYVLVPLSDVKEEVQDEIKRLRGTEK